MILQALHEYHQRKVDDGIIAPVNFTQRKIDFLVVLDQNGRFNSLDCLQERKGKRLLGKAFFVPAIGKQAEKHDNSCKDANLLWDKSEFVLGVGKKGAAKIESFIATIAKYFPIPPADIQAVLNFLKFGKHDLASFSAILDHTDHGELIRSGSPLLSFKMVGKPFPVFCESFVKTAIEQYCDEVETYGPCLVTGGQHVPIEMTHPVVKGVLGAQISGANLVSFNQASFLSHRWKQSHNSPVGKHAAAAYAKSLNYLVGSELNRIRVGDATTVFWSQMNALPEFYNLEQDFSWFFADPPKDNPERGVRAVKSLYDAVHTGRIPMDEGQRFYVLGLAPNAARIAVRFWRTGTVGEFAERIKRHFDEVEIVRGPQDPTYLTLNQILRSTAFEYKMDNVPPNLAGAVVGCVLDGTPYPITLAHQCIRRIRAERRVTRARAAILKAYINRLSLYEEPLRKEEITVSLDRTNTSPGYRLGRLFAMLEKIQEEANPGINATIRDRFYGAASTSPVAVFPQLLKLKNHHLSKLDNPGRKVNLEKEIREIFCGVNDFPAHFSMEEQARFAIGYYHQRQSFFSK
jgi:CRISPR-associated protein Csd1